MRKQTWIKAVLTLILLNFVVYGLIPFTRDAHAALKTWNTGEVIKAADLNGNFTFVNNASLNVATVSDTNVASNAAIAHSKLKTPALVPKAWASLQATCTGSATAGTACNIGASSQVTSITTNGTTGVFRLNLGYTPVDSKFLVMVQPNGATSGISCNATTFATTTPNAVITCFTTSTGAAVDVNQFQVLVMDNDN